jgi:hypothetical protein
LIPYELIAQYASQTPTTYTTTPTVGEVITQVAVEYPYSTAAFTDATLVGWMNEKIGEIWRYSGHVKIFTTNTSTDSKLLYQLPSDCRIDKIRAVLMSDSTAASSTAAWSRYDYVASGDVAAGSQWFDALGGRIGFASVPGSSTDGGYLWGAIYDAVPTKLTTASTDIIGVNSELGKQALVARLKKKIAQSGNNPDVEMANNFQSDEYECDRKLRMDYMKRKKPENQWSYRRGYWRG